VLEKSGSFGVAEGLVCGQGKAKCPTCEVAEIHFFVELDVLLFLGSVCVSPNWSAGLCRDTAHLSAVLRSSRKSGQDVKGRWFNCLVDGCCVLCQACL